MINLMGQPGELRFTIEVKRKDTGIVETYDMVGTISADDLKQEVKDGSNTFNSGS